MNKRASPNTLENMKHEFNINVMNKKAAPTTLDRILSSQLIKPQFLIRKKLYQKTYNTKVQ